MAQLRGGWTVFPILCSRRCKHVSQGKKKKKRVGEGFEKGGLKKFGKLLSRALTGNSHGVSKVLRIPEIKKSV